MSKFRKLSVFLVLLLVSLLVFAACSNQSETSGNNEESNDDSNNNVSENIEEEPEEQEPGEKEKIVIAFQWGEENFWMRFGPIAEHINIDIEFVPTNGTLERFEEMFAAEIYPDIIIDNNVFAMQDLDIIYHLDDLIEQSGFDLSILNPALVDRMRAYDPEGRLIGLPDGTSNYALYYNKDIFDLFGQDYPDPEKPMTWDEVLDLARAMTAERDGVQYIGLTGPTNWALNQFAPTATDPDTGEVLIQQNEAYKRYFDLLAEFYAIPGINDEPNLGNTFVEKRAAMTMSVNLGLSWIGGDDVEPIDMAPFPVWPDMPNTGPEKGATPMVIANYSEKKELALEVLKTYFEPEMLLSLVRAGALIPPVSDPEIQRQYAVEVDLYKGKNLNAYHVLEPARRTSRFSRWDKLVNISAAEGWIREGKDVGTVLRQLEEESAAKIKEAMEAQ